MEIEYNLAEELVNSSLKNLNTEKRDLALKSLNIALKLYTKFISEETNTDTSANLYFKRAEIYKNLGFDYSSNYYLDIKLSMLLGNLLAKTIFESKEFKKNNEEEKIDFVFDIFQNSNGSIELSSLFLKGHLNWIDKIKIVHNNNESRVFTNFNFVKDNDLKKIKMRLLLGVTFSDNFICNDLEKTRKMIKEIFNNNTLDEILNSPNGLSLIEEIQKVKNYDSKSRNTNDSFNLLFNSSISDSKDSEINTIIVAECYSFLKFINKYPFVCKNNIAIHKFISI